MQYDSPNQGTLLTTVLHFSKANYTNQHRPPAPAIDEVARSQQPGSHRSWAFIATLFRAHLGNFFEGSGPVDRTQSGF